MLASTGRLQSHSSARWTTVPSCTQSRSLLPRFMRREGHQSSLCTTATARNKAGIAPVGAPTRQRGNELCAHPAGPAGGQSKASDNQVEAGVIWDAANERWIARLGEKTASGGSYKRLTFSAAVHGFEQAKQKAIAARQESLQRQNAQPKKQGMPGTALYQSHVKGVYFNGTPGEEKWIAAWHKSDGTRFRTSFNVKEFGLEEAQQRAEKARLDAEKRGEARLLRQKAMP